MLLCLLLLLHLFLASLLPPLLLAPLATSAPLLQVMPGCCCPQPSSSPGDGSARGPQQLPRMAPRCWRCSLRPAAPAAHALPAPLLDRQAAAAPSRGSPGLPPALGR